jgi:hypothetical protein
MQHLLMIYTNEQETASMSPAALNALMQEFAEFTKSIVQAGQFKAGDRLKPLATASTVRVRNGKAAASPESEQTSRRGYSCSVLVSINPAGRPFARIRPDSPHRLGS